ncbi:Hypothetical protein ERWE_CDS_00320 [Ehrlichia ruminantium str. Welgevonden]|uniref:Uncharacterized protein n=1 Tax=Ehrlichia ruminantium (strain Welgevonden) TaxID=254945 RepID=A0A0H3LYF8_EHRRW|nr:Hypothetical protein ERWE_CDS_00320 [Ehrlichia ruminantium str. Welgevonden]
MILTTFLFIINKLFKTLFILKHKLYLMSQLSYALFIKDNSNIQKEYKSFNNEIITVILINYYFKFFSSITKVYN